MSTSSLMHRRRPPLEEALRHPPPVPEADAVVARLRSRLPEFEARARREQKRWFTWYVNALGLSTLGWLLFTWWVYPTKAQAWMAGWMVRVLWLRMLLFLLPWRGSLWPVLVLASVLVLFAVWIRWLRWLWQTRMQLPAVRHAAGNSGSRTG